MSAVKIVTGNDPLIARQILTWFARQAEEVQTNIMRRKHKEFMALLKRFPRLAKPSLELAALVLVARASGWDDEQAYRSSRTISEAAAKSITDRRKRSARAYSAHRDQVRLWLAKNWGKVMDIRRAGLSWRRVAAVIRDDHGLSVSHTTLHSYWRRWNEQC